MSTNQTKNTLFAVGQAWSLADEIIDVRTPAEYALDHIPGSINLPVLSDEQRIEVGTIYKQIGKFEAKKLGAALISANISQHLLNHFQHKPESYRPLIYCWRGGQRSQSLGLILQKIGFGAKVLQSGYKGYRRHVLTVLENAPQQFRYNVLCGLTGAGKTAELARLAALGAQVLDLEALAAHRGSLLGAEVDSTQPSQKQFDSRLARAFEHFDSTRPIWLESEGEKIGKIQLPKTLWQQMRQGTCTWLECSRERRVENILKDYSHFMKDPDLLKQRLHLLKPVVSSEVVERWFAFIDARNWSALVHDLLLTHYDDCYLKALKKNYRVSEMR